MDITNNFPKNDGNLEYSFYFAEIFDESLESEGGMGIRDEREKVKVRKEKLGGYFFSLSQLTFTGTGVGGFLPLLKGEATVGDVSVLILVFWLQLFLQV